MIEMCAVFVVFVRLVVVQSCVLHIHFSTDCICQVEVLIVVTHSSTVCWGIKQKSTCCGFFKNYMYMFPVFVCCCCSVMFHVYMYYINLLWVTLPSFVWIVMDMYYLLWWSVSFYSGISFTTHVQIWLCANCNVWSSWKLTVCWLCPQNGCWNPLLCCYKLPYWGEHEQASHWLWQQFTYVCINISSTFGAPWLPKSVYWSV